MTTVAVGSSWLDALRVRVPARLARLGGGRFSPVTIAATAVLGAIVLAAVLAPLLTPYDPAVGVVQDRLKPPGTPGHLLGTDELGRDMATRLMFGARVSLLAAVVPIGIATGLALVLGLVAGYRGGLVGQVIMRVLDVLFAFPAIMLAIGITAALGPGVQNAFGALVLVFTPPVARVVEAGTRRVAAMEFIDAARLTGRPPGRVLFSQVLPNVLPSVLTYAVSLMGVSMLLMAGLSFVGLGVSPPTAEWGFMLGSLRNQLYTAPVNAIIPGLAIFVTAVSLNTISDGLRDREDR